MRYSKSFAYKTGPTLHIHAREIFAKLTLELLSFHRFPDVIANKWHEKFFQSRNIQCIKLTVGSPLKLIIAKQTFSHIHFDTSVFSKGILFLDAHAYSCVRNLESVVIRIHFFQYLYTIFQLSKTKVYHECLIKAGSSVV